MNPFPFSESRSRRNHNSFTRTFSKNVDPKELAWHKDRKNRIIIPIQGKEWKFQYDNELPFLLEEGKFYFIEKETWHRLLLDKSTDTTDLVLLVWEL